MLISRRVMLLVAQLAKNAASVLNRRQTTTELRC